MLLDTSRFDQLDTQVSLREKWNPEGLEKKKEKNPMWALKFFKKTKE